MIVFSSKILPMNCWQWDYCENALLLSVLFLFFPIFKNYFQCNSIYVSLYWAGSIHLRSIILKPQMIHFHIFKPIYCMVHQMQNIFQAVWSACCFPLTYHVINSTRSSHRGLNVQEILNSSRLWNLPGTASFSQEWRNKSSVQLNSVKATDKIKHKS